MQLTIYQVDAFTETIFGGNPAAVVPLKEWLPDTVMQNIAMENNLSETAFFVSGSEDFHIRWFTPVTEVNLCGHATLASAHVIFNHLQYLPSEITFQSKSGVLTVQKKGSTLVLNFPASELEEMACPADAGRAFGRNPQKCIRGREDLLFVFGHEQDIRDLQPDLEILKKWDTRGIIVTAPSSEYDFVSRFFAPAEGIDEDPVTGSAHTVLVPFWAEQLGKKELIAKQISPRGGILHCTCRGERITIGGSAVTYLEGTIAIPCPH